MRRFILSLALAPLVVGALMFRAEDAPAAAVFNTNHDCSFCHGVHGGDATQLLANPVVESLCLSCHGPGGPATIKADIHTNDTGNSCCTPFRVSCRDCHDPHSNQINWRGGTNLMLMRDSVAWPRDTTIKRPVTFESRGTNVGDPEFRSYCDGTGEGGVWDRVCDTCHDPTVNRHKYTDPGNHNHQVGRTCTRSGCHEHATAFNP